MASSTAERQGEGKRDIISKPSPPSPTPASSARPTSPPSPPPPAPVAQRHQRLLELRLKLNAGRRDNAREAKDEVARMSGTANSTRPAAASHSTRPAHAGARRRKSTGDGETRAGEADAKPAKRAKVREEKVDPEVAPILVEPAEVAQSKYRHSQRKRNRKEGRDSSDEDDAAPTSAPLRSESADELQARLLVGRDVFNSDTAHLHYQRRIQRAKAATGGGAVSGVSAAKASGSTSYTDRQQPSEAAIDRLVEDELEAAKASASFSRRRRFNPGEDVSYISETNRTFNKKLNRAYDQFTLDIAQNIERGTAL